ncbi:MAG: PilN domain-containing protein [Acidobacteriaceae bacterium]
MRVTLNLASRPYVELRPLYRRLQLLGSLLIITALVFWWVLRTEHTRASAAQARVASIQNSIARAKADQQHAEAAMHQPANAAVLQQAQFLNGVFLRKAFSWTAVMMDLEQVLPSGVQVMNIDPQISKDGHVIIRMRVAGPRERAVDLMRNLEKSHRFLQPRLVGEAAQTSGSSNVQAVNAPTGVNFDLLADYNPLPPKAAKAETKSSGSKAGTAKRHRRRAKKVAKPSPAGSAAAGSGGAR